MKYSWLIDQLDCKPRENEATDVVVIVHWRLMATDGTYNAVVGSALTLDAYDGKNAFIEYKDLSKEDVIEWVQSKLGKDEIASLKSHLDGVIKNQQTPQIVTLDLPWVVAQTTISTDNDQAAQAAQGV
jgi:hypothetical protein